MDKQKIKKSTPEALETYAARLDQFITTIADYMMQIKKAHEVMHEHWSGDQYDNFTDYLENVSADVKKQLVDLDQTKLFIKDKAQKLRDARSVKIKR